MGRSESPAALRDRRRQEILVAARRLVAAAGLEAMTISRLEGELGFTRGVITYHFKNKDDIVRGLLEHALDEIDAATGTSVERSASFSDKLAAAVRQTVRGFVTNVEAGRVLLSFWTRIPTDPHAAEMNARLYARYRRHAAHILTGGIEAGEFRADLPVEPMAANVVGTIIGLVVQVYFEEGAIDLDASVEAGVAALLAGCRLL